MMWYSKRFLCFLMCGICLTYPTFVFTDSTQTVDDLNAQIATKQAKIKELENSINQTKQNITAKQLQATSLKNQTAILDNRITQVQLDIDLTNQKLDEISLELQTLKISIDEKQKTIAREEAMIEELLRSLQYDDAKNYLQVMAAYNTFSEFYNKLQNIQTVEKNLDQNTRALRSDKADLETDQAQTLERQKSYQALKDTLQNQKQDLDEAKTAKQTLLAQTRSSELVYKSLLTNLQRQSAAIEGEISSIESEVRKRLEAQNKLPASLDSQYNGLFSWPVPSHYITTYFHDPEYPFRNIFQHSGLDIRASQGTPVHAAGSGYVGQAKHCTTASCYSYVMLIHPGGLATLYGHLSGIVVTNDQFVSRGDVIGYSGATPGTIGAGPFVTGPHLHFEVRMGGVPIDPLPYLMQQ